MNSYVIINKPAVFIYGRTCETWRDEDGGIFSTVVDEALYGNVYRVLKEEQDYLYVISSYGYAGYIKKDAVLPVQEPEMREWLENAVVTDGICTDILSGPTVHAGYLMTLPRGSLLYALDSPEEHYTRVRLADGSQGFISTNRLMEKRFGEEMLGEYPDTLIALQADAAAKCKHETGGKAGYDLQDTIDRWYADETAFRKELVHTAEKYLGVQYRWGGRSSFGIDCSGLIHMSYLLCGVCIFRDAAIVKDYPLERLDLSWTDSGFDLSNLDNGTLRPGDTLYFPKHVAMYIGDGLYIHSTGRAGVMQVTVNSLLPDHSLFRKEHLESIYAAAGLRLKRERSSFAIQ